MSRNEHLTIADLYRLQQECTDDLKTTIRQVEKNLIEELSSASQRIIDLEHENISLKNKLEILDRKIRKNNLVIFGIDTEAYNNQQLPEFIVGKLNNLLGTSVNVEDVSDAYVIGRSNNSKKPIVVEFARYIAKAAILSNVRKLKGSGIFVNNDSTPSQRKDSYKLRTHLKLAKSKSLNAFIKGYTLHINGETYRAEELPEISEGEEFELPAKRLTNSAPPTPSSVPHQAEHSNSDLSAPPVCIRASGEEKTVCVVANKDVTSVQSAPLKEMEEGIKMHSSNYGRELRSNISKTKSISKYSTPPTGGARRK